CGTTRHATRLDELETVPGAPLIRAPKRKRISQHDLVPLSLKDEYEQVAREREIRGVRSGADRTRKFVWAAATGAALTAMPLAVPGFLFLPLKSTALMLVGLDLVVGAAAGFLTLRLKGGLF